jgi:hypothetical protein
MLSIVHIRLAARTIREPSMLGQVACRKLVGYPHGGVVNAGQFLRDLEGRPQPVPVSH